MKKIIFSLLVLFCITLNSNALSSIDFKVSKLIISYPVLLVNHFPCPPGSHGEGYYIWRVKDSETGELLGSGFYGEGCTNDDELIYAP